MVLGAMLWFWEVHRMSGSDKAMSRELMSHSGGVITAPAASASTDEREVPLGPQSAPSGGIGGLGAIGHGTRGNSTSGSAPAGSASSASQDGTEPVAGTAARTEQQARQEPAGAPVERERMARASTEMETARAEQARVERAQAKRAQEEQARAERAREAEAPRAAKAQRRVVLRSASVVVAPPKSAPPAAGSAAPSTPDPLPSPSPARLPVDAVLEQMTVGNMVFNRPASMVRGEAKRVTLLISQSSTIDELKAELGASAGAVREQQIRIAPLMQARLTGSAFAITPITPEEQPMSSSETTEWQWEIKPAEFGQLPLHLSVDMIVTIDGQERRRHLRSFEETIIVEVAWGPWIASFVWENIEWLVTAIVLPLGLWLVKRWRKRRRQRKEPPPSVRPPARRPRGRQLAEKLWKAGRPK